MQGLFLRRSYDVDVKLLITFSIADGYDADVATGYQAEEGMTWAEWCSSAYNTDGFKVDDYGWIVDKDELYLVFDYDDQGQKGSDVIMSGYTYYWDVNI